LSEEQRRLWPETDKSLCLTFDDSLKCNGSDVDEVDGTSTYTERKNSPVEAAATAAMMGVVIDRDARSATE